MGPATRPAPSPRRLYLSLTPAGTEREQRQAITTAVTRRNHPVPPLDHLRLWFVGLDSDLQYEIAFALVPALVDDFKGRRFRSERDFIKALEAWLAPTRFF